MRAPLALVSLLLASTALAQTRQPAQITTLPATIPQEFDLLDKGGNWTPLGVASGGAGVNLRQFGCVDDGVTDQAACINTALASQAMPVIMPPTQNGWYVNSTITVNGTLLGQAFNPINPNAFTATGPWNWRFPGNSWIKCGPAANPCLRIGTLNALQNAPRVENLILSSDGTPAAGVVGLNMAGGTNLNTRNIGVFNFDACVKWGPISGTANAISAFHDNFFVGACKTHYFVNDGWPEVTMIGGRGGLNGYGAYNTAEDVFLYQMTANQIGGGGVNTIRVRNFNFSDAGGGAVACVARFANQTGTVVPPSGNFVNSGYWFSDSHFEWHSPYVGAASEGYFCSDSTVPRLATLHVDHNTFARGLSKKVWNLDPATALETAFISHNEFGGCNGVTDGFKINMPADSTSDGGYHAVHLTGNTIVCDTVLTNTGTGTNVLLSVGNSYDGSFALSGNWGMFTSAADAFLGSSYTDAATGNVSMAAWRQFAWTPALQFGGVSTGITYNFDLGTYARTATGGFRATVNMKLTSKGTATGSAQIAGMPLGCKATGGPGTAPVSLLGGAGLTASPFAQMGTATPAPIFLTTVGATGNAALTDANFTNTSTIQFAVECGTAS